ncbi:MAG TPA: hypothetical protein VNO86_05825, partial [Candidatus Binatia bacterium]|nr:hypothetical protein [Candidatus Binatia bacterium]
MNEVGASTLVRARSAGRRPHAWFLVAGLAVVGLLAYLQGAAPGTAPAAPSTIVLHPSWAMGYDSLDGLRAAADLAVVVRVSEVVAEGADLETPEIPASVFRMTIERTIKGTSGPTVFVIQTGGRLHGIRFVLEDDPLMEVGDRYVLYLTRVPGGPYVERYGPDIYAVVGGPDGRFAVA